MVDRIRVVWIRFLVCGEVLKFIVIWEWMGIDCGGFFNRVVML